MQKKYDTANLLHQAKQLEKAEILYNEIINNDSTEKYLLIGSYYNLGIIYRTYFTNNRYNSKEFEYRLDEAIKQFNNIPLTDEKFGYSAMSTMAECYILKKNYVDAYECFLKLLKRSKYNKLDQQKYDEFIQKRIVRLFLKKDEWEGIYKHFNSRTEEYGILIYDAIIEEHLYHREIEYSQIKNIMTELIKYNINVVPLVLNRIDELWEPEHYYYNRIINWITPHGIMILPNIEKIIEYNIIDENNMTRYFSDNIDITNIHGETMLMYAVKHNYPLIVKQCMKKGANPFLQNKLGENSFDIVMACGNIESQDQIIYYLLKYYNRSNAQTFHDKIYNLLKRPDVPENIKKLYI